MLYKIDVNLRYIEPPIRRTLLVPARTSLFKFHKILQVAMGWENCHLYLFRIDKQLYSDEPEAMDMDVKDARKITLEKVFSEGVTSFVYEYDMGDGWLHDIILTGKQETSGKERIFCIDGARACPPEDVGGPPGYVNFLEVLADPNHEEHEELMEWIGGEQWDAEYFDLDETDQAVKRVR